jgi:hypothetical protein
MAATSVTTPAPTTNAPVPVIFVTNHFRWRQVEAADFEQLARNLRTVGCPEKTVRDVIIARARRALDRLRRGAETKLPSSTTEGRRATDQREADHDLAVARAQLIAGVDRAVGQDVFTEDEKLMEDLVSQAIVRFLSGPMPEDTFSRLAVLLSRQDAKRDEARARAQGTWIEDDESVAQNLSRQFHRELAAMLLPVELEEFIARRGAMKLADRARFEATDLSSVEIRQIALIRGRCADPAVGEWFDGDSLTDQQEAQAANAIREFLGESRYTQLARAEDDNFKTLFDLCCDHSLPRTAAVDAFEVRQLAAQEVARLRQDQSLSEADRQQQFAKMQSQLQEGVLQVLGAEGCAQYLQRGGVWLTNLNGL